MKNNRLIFCISIFILMISSISVFQIASFATKEPTNSSAVSTPYGNFIPLENQTPEAYPFAVFNPDKTLKGLYTNWKSAIGAAAAIDNSVVYLRADVDRSEGEGGFRSEDEL